VSPRPLLPEGEIPSNSSEGINVVSMLTSLMRVNRAAKPTAEGQADNLAWLIHLVGDIHQPLHCAQQFTPQSPRGDRGGNDVPLTGRWKNLHQLWDDGLNLNNAKVQSLRLPEELMRQNPQSQFRRQLASKDPKTWAKEGYDLAVHDAYLLPDNGGAPSAPSARYLQNVEKVSRESVTLAGYRLAGVLNKWLK
jgi:hypothetical protein